MLFSTVYSTDKQILFISKYSENIYFILVSDKVSVFNLAVTLFLYILSLPLKRKGGMHIRLVKYAHLLLVASFM